MQGINCLAANTCGLCLSLLSITLQGCTSFRHLSFHSVHCLPQASATRARVLPFIPLRSCLPAVSFRSPLASLPTSFNSKPKREAPFHPTQFATLYSVTTLAFPNPASGITCRLFAPENKRPHNSPPPFNGAGKNKEHSHKSMCLQPFRFTHSNVTFVPHYTISFVHLTSFSTARVSISFLNTHTFHHPQQHTSHLFLPADCLPHKTGSRSLSLCSAWLKRSIMLLVLE